MNHLNKRNLGSPSSLTPQPPTLIQRLLRNIIVGLIFTPLAVVGVVINERLFRSAFAVDDVRLQGIALVVAFALIMVVVFAWRGIGEWVDRWILRGEAPSSITHSKAKEYNWLHDPLKDLHRYHRHYRSIRKIKLFPQIVFISIFLFIFYFIMNFDSFILAYAAVAFFLTILFVLVNYLLEESDFSKNYVLNPQTRDLILNYDEQIAKGNYLYLHQRLKQAKAIYIDWETMFITAKLDIYTGQLERGLGLVDQLLSALMYGNFKPNGNHEALRQKMLFRALSLRLEGLILQGNYRDANDLVEELLQSKEQVNFSYLNNTIAGLYLFHGDHKQAVKYLLKSRRFAEQLPKSWLVYNRILWAWSIAYQRDLEMTEKFIRSAFENSNPKFKLYHSRIYLIAGFARRELGQTDLMRLMFEQATRIDPEGVYGKLARRELEASSPNVAKLKRGEPYKAKS